MTNFLILNLKETLLKTCSQTSRQTKIIATCICIVAEITMLDRDNDTFHRREVQNQIVHEIRQAQVVSYSPNNRYLSILTLNTINPPYCILPKSDLPPSYSPTLK
jgi:hypothetical protein